MFSRIWLKTCFFVKSLMGTPLDWKFFTLKKKSHFHLLLGQTRAQNKSCSKLDIRYLRRMCFSSCSFLTQITNPMGLEGFIWLESLFVGQKKVASNRLRFQQQVAWMWAVISRRGNRHKSPMGMVSPVSTPLLPGSEGKGKGSVPKSCFKSAKNRSASSL